MSIYQRWYRQGTAAVTTGNATVTGTLTAWLADVRPGDGFTIDGTRWVEIQSVESNTSLTLAEPWSGATATGAAYRIDRRSVLRQMAADVGARLAAYIGLIAALPTPSPTDAGKLVALTATGFEAVSAAGAGGASLSSGGVPRAGLGLVGYAPTTFVVAPNGVSASVAIAETSAQWHYDNIALGLMTQSAATISNAAPAVVTWVGHGIPAGTEVALSTTGTLPEPFVAATTYYVVSAGLTADTFQLAATPAGAAIATTTAGAGVHTVKCNRAPPGFTFKIPDYNATNGGSDHALGAVGVSTINREFSIQGGSDGPFNGQNNVDVVITTLDTGGAAVQRASFGGGDNVIVGLGVSASSATAPTQGTLLHLHTAGSGSSLLHFSNAATGRMASNGAYVGLDHVEQLLVQQLTPNPLLIQTTDAAADIQFATNAGGIALFHRTTGHLGLGAMSFTPSFPLSFYGSAPKQIGIERHPTPDTAGSSLTISAGGAAAGATNKAGGNLIFQSGAATGTGGSTIQFQVPTPGADGTADSTPVTALQLSSNSSASTGTILEVARTAAGASIATVRAVLTDSIAPSTHASSFSTQYAAGAWRTLFRAAGTNANDGSMQVFSENGVRRIATMETVAASSFGRVLVYDTAGFAQIELRANATASYLHIGAGNAMPVGGNLNCGIKFSSAANTGLFWGLGEPTLVAGQGSLYLRGDGNSPSTRMYSRTAAGWTPVTTGS